MSLEERLAEQDAILKKMGQPLDPLEFFKLDLKKLMRPVMELWREEEENRRKQLEPASKILFQSSVFLDQNKFNSSTISNFTNTLQEYRAKQNDLDELTRTVGRISSSIVPDMNLPDSFEALVQNPKIFEEQIQNIVALENTQYKNDYVEIEQRDLDTVSQSVGGEATEKILNELEIPNEPSITTKHKITVEKCIKLFKTVIGLLISTITVSIPLICILPEPYNSMIKQQLENALEVLSAVNILIPKDENSLRLR